MNISVLALCVVMLFGLGFYVQAQPAGFVEIGKRVPDFVLKNDANEDWQLSKNLGRPLLIYFYPSDGTPGCTAQACSLNGYEQFRRSGLKIVGVSYNSIKSHQKFKKQYGLRFDLLSDPDARVAKMFKASRWWPNLMPLRKTFIIDSRGFLRHIIDDIDVAKHAEQILPLIADL
ncbi:peroxiredoxin [Candidatus Dependentiae bacterium]|nr:peroxiredoxin [Candidatus Dependentiae bacterium]